jgi:sugar-specific transcriptional regulator TrmB
MKTAPVRSLVSPCIVRNRMLEDCQRSLRDLRSEVKEYYESFNHAERTLINELIGTYRKLATMLESR